MAADDEITLEQAAQTERVAHNPDLPPEQWPANQSGAEATAALETMLSAGHQGKRVRGT